MTGHAALRRIAKVLAWIVGLAAGLPIAAVALLLVVANTGVGQREIARLVGQITSGQVTLHDIGGRFPDRLRVASIELHDAQGIWLSLDDVTLDWSPLRLLQRIASVQLLSAADVHVRRLPAAKTSSSSSAGGSFNLPVQVELQKLQVDRLALDKPVAGAPAMLSVTGSARLQSLQQGHVTLDVARLDGAGTYHLAGTLDPSRITAELHAAEPAGGLVSGLAGLPNLGAITADASVAGPRRALVLQLALHAGALQAAADGTVDLQDMTANLHVTGSAPAMAPRPDVSWQSVALDARVSGPFTRPDATGTVRIAGLAAGGASAQTVALDLSGNQGAVTLQGSLAGLRIPGPKPDFLADDPITLAATAQLDAPDRPVTLQVTTRLLAVSASARLAPSLVGDVKVHLADLAPFAGIAGLDVQGHADLAGHVSRDGDRTQATADGQVAITGGMKPLPALIGDAHLSLAASLHGGDITVDHAQVDGRTLTASVSGTDNQGVLALDYQAALSDLAALAPNLAGHLAATGRVAGQTTGLTASADLNGEVTAQGVASGPLHAVVQAEGLPGAPQATLQATGALAGAPLQVAASVSRGADGSLSAQINRVDWQSAHVDGTLALAAGATLPTGQLNLAMTRLDQLRPLLGTPVAGSIEAHVDLPAERGPASGSSTRGGPARLSLTARDVDVSGDKVGKLDVAGTLTDPLGRRVVDLQATATGIEAAGASGNLRLQASGPQDALAVKLTVDGHDPSGQPAQTAATATIDATTKQLLVSSLSADWHGLQPRLLAPVRVSFADGVAVDRLRLGIAAATLDLAGTLTPRLDATLAVRNVTPDLARAFDPTLAADGQLQADARLTGTPARPDGQIRVSATGLRLRSGPARALPPASILATADLAGGAARLDVSVTAGKNRLALTGQAPLNAAGALALRLTGAINLALLDPILTANGRRVRGEITLDAAIGGTAHAPRVDGSVRLANGEVQDFTQGIHLTDVTANLQAAGDTLRIQQFTAHAGSGTLSAAGSVGVLTTDLPLDLTITARHARLLASDKLTATIDADLTLKGQASSALAAAGKLVIDAAEIRIPETMPASVVSLNVVRAGQPPPPPPSPGVTVSLAIDIAAPNPVFVRGRGLNAELEGNMKVGGTVAAPLPSGGLTMRRGTFSVAGTTLTFTKGEVQFGGAGISDPNIDFVASSVNATVTANLEISGSASHPKITLSSTPELPQDEVLAQLLFGTSESQLSPFQIAGIAQTLAQFSGVGGGLVDPLEAVRQGLGLDRLSVGGGTNNALQAGRYVATGVYVGAKQALTSSKPANGAADPTTQATVQIDLTKRLKIEGDVGSGVGANAVGLTYQFEYGR